MPVTSRALELLAWSALAFGVVGAGVALDRGPLPGLALLESSRLPCVPSGLLGVGAAERLGAGWALYTTSAVRLRGCTSGTLRLRLRGSVAGRRGPTAVVALGDRTLWEGEVARPTDLELPVTRPGWIVVSFPDDLYRPPEDRNLWIDSLSFDARP